MVGAYLNSLYTEHPDPDTGEEVRTWLERITFTPNTNERNLDLVEILTSLGYEKGDILDFILILAVTEGMSPIVIENQARKDMYSLAVFKNKLDTYLNWDRFIPIEGKYKVTKKALDHLTENDLTPGDLPDPPANHDRYTLAEVKKMVREIKKIKDRPITKEEAHALLLYARIFDITPSAIKRKFNIHNIVDMKYSSLVRAYRWILQGIRDLPKSQPYGPTGP